MKLVFSPDSSAAHLHITTNEELEMLNLDQTRLECINCRLATGKAMWLKKSAGVEKLAKWNQEQERSSVLLLKDIPDEELVFDSQVATQKNKLASQIACMLTE